MSNWKQIATHVLLFLLISAAITIGNWNQWKTFSTLKPIQTAYQKEPVTDYNYVDEFGIHTPRTMTMKEFLSPTVSPCVPINDTTNCMLTLPNLMTHRSIILTINTLIDQNNDIVDVTNPSLLVNIISCVLYGLALFIMVFVYSKYNDLLRILFLLVINMVAVLCITLVFQQMVASFVSRIYEVYQAFTSMALFKEWIRPTNLPCEPNPSLPSCSITFTLQMYPDFIQTVVDLLNVQESNPSDTLYALAISTSVITGVIFLFTILIIEIAMFNIASIENEAQSKRQDMKDGSEQGMDEYDTGVPLIGPHDEILTEGIM